MRYKKAKKKEQITKFLPISPQSSFQQEERAARRGKGEGLSICSLKGLS